jgi:hypothetical protein
MNRICTRPGRTIAVVALACLASLGGPGWRSSAEVVERPAAGDELSIDQARVADRFERLETVLARLAELSAGSDPRRARVLREAIAKSREQGIDQRFETIVSLLEDERLSAAAGRQTELEKELDDLLMLLLKADRDRELDSQHKRIKAYLKEVGRLIRLEKGLKARTEGGDETKRLAQDQKQVGDQTGELGKSISDTAKKDGDSSKGDASKNEKPADGKPGESGQSGQSSPSDQQQPPQEPTDRAAERLKQAQQAMKQAQKQLEDSERKGASASQREALKQLEEAKAELERVLRQLREEEMERTLTLLAARFRKMLEAQTRIYEGTKRLDRVPEADRDHNEEIEAARLSREESLLVREADRALVLLREEGSSMAFPETVSLMRDDMQQVTERLSDMKVGTLTQELEEDIIEALEETIAALDKAMKDLEKKKTPPGQAPPAGQPGDPPLVDKIAELKMIRALQMRINRRTERYGQIIEGEQAETPELLDALAKLAERQQRVYQATSDLSQGRND